MSKTKGMNLNGFPNIQSFEGKYYTLGRFKTYVIVYSSEDWGITWDTEYVINADSNLISNIALTLAISQRQILLVLNAGRNIWFDGVWHDQEAIKATCSCDLKLIMSKGCQCGGT